MDTLLVGASLSLAWPAGSLLEIADGRNVAGSAGAILSAWYFSDDPIFAYAVASAVFGVTTYMAAKSDPKIVSAYEFVDGYRTGSTSTRNFDAMALGSYIGMNQQVGIFVTGMQQAISAQSSK